MIRRTLRALAIWLALPCAAACGPSRSYVCSVGGVDVLDLVAPARVGRLEVVSIEARLRSRNGRELVAACVSP
jgi:hypothetical protein